MGKYLFTTTDSSKIMEKIKKLPPDLQNEFQIFLKDQEEAFDTTVKNILIENSDILWKFMILRGNRKRKVFSEYEQAVKTKESAEDILLQL